MGNPLIAISRRQALLFATFFVLYEFLTYIANDMIMPGMIGVIASFKAPESAIATSLTAYVLGGASLQIILGPLSDRFGRRPVMLNGAALFFLFTVFIACTQSMHQFLIARFFQGMGLCFIGVVGYATMQEIFSEMDAIRLIAIMSNVAILAPLVGPLLGAVFVYYIGWRSIFFIISVFALMAWAGLLRYMPEPVGKTTRTGVLIPRISLNPVVIAKNYKTLLLNKGFIWGSLSLGVLAAPCIVWIALSPIMIITDAHLSVMIYGLWQIPLFGAIILGSILLQPLTYRYSIQQLIYGGSLLVGIGLALTFLLPYSINPSFEWLIPGLVIYFFATGVVSAPLTRFILFSTHVSKGMASALQSMIGMCVQGICIELANKIYSHHSNMAFAIYCFLMGLVYFGTLVLSFVYLKRPVRLSTE